MSDSTREEIEARRGALSDFLFTIFDMGTSPNALREADAILEMLDALASRPAPAETPSETDFWTCGRCGNLTPLDLATPPAPVGEREREKLAKHLCRREAGETWTLDRVLDHMETWRRYLPEADEILKVLSRKVVS